MAVLGKSIKKDMLEQCNKLGIETDDSLRAYEIKDLIVKSPRYDEEYIKFAIIKIIEELKELQELELRKIEMKNLDKTKHLEYEQKIQKHVAELEKIKLQLEAEKLRIGKNPSQACNVTKLPLLNITKI